MTIISEKTLGNITDSWKGMALRNDPPQSLSDKKTSVLGS